MHDQPILLVGLGASTAVGRDAWASAAAVRAGLAGFAQHPYMVDTVGSPMRVAMAPWLDGGLTVGPRCESLVLPAIDQALAPLLDAVVEPIRIGLCLGVPGPRPGLPEHFARDLLRAVQGRRPGRFATASLHPNGHAAGLLALRSAIAALGDGALDACVVAGVDSYLDPLTLEWLEACDQLHSAGPLNNAWGFVPGEGAGALLLVRRNAEVTRHLPALAGIVGIGAADEPRRIKTQTICLGEGLTQAFATALSGLPADALVNDVYCDMNGEPYRADEYGFACLRSKASFADLSNFVAPADCWGDVGAAGGPLGIALAAVAGFKGYARGRWGFTWCSSESGERAAVLTEAYRGH